MAFVAMNPGGGPREGLGPADRALYRVLRALRDSTEADTDLAFRELTVLLEPRMARGKIGQNFISPVLGYTQLDYTEIAYLNLLKWRTRQSSGLRRLYDVSWQAHTAEQLSLLSPSTVIAIGSSAGRALCRYSPHAFHVEIIPRVIGSNIGAEGRAALGRVRDWFDEHPLGSTRAPRRPAVKR